MPMFANPLKNVCTGKTMVVKQVAMMLGFECQRINLSKETTIPELFGSTMPYFEGNKRMFKWMDGPITIALRRKMWVLLDEINLAPPEVLEVLIGLLERGAKSFHIPGTMQDIDIKESRIFATMNDASEGGGRLSLEQSLLNRFMQVKLENHTDAELHLIMMEKFMDLGSTDSTQNRSISDSQRDGIFGLHKEVRGCVSRREIGRSGGPYRTNLRDLTKVRDIIAMNIGNLHVHYGLLCEDGKGGGSEDFTQVIVRRAVEIVYKHRFSSREDQEKVQQLIDKHLCPSSMETSTAPVIDVMVPGYARIGSIYISRNEDMEDASQHDDLHYSPAMIKDLEIVATASESMRAVLLQVSSASCFYT